jgi:hypothetical protein
MDYVLYLYGAFVVALVVVAAGIARALSRSISEPIGPSYRPGSPSWLAQQERKLAVVAPAAARTLPELVELPSDFYEAPSAETVAREVEELERQLARVTAPEVEGATIVHWEAPPTYVQAEMGESGGAEQWGDLLAGMSTEEQTIYNLQMVLDHDEHKAVEREFQTELDRTVARVLAQLARENEAAERRALYWENAAARRAGYVDEPTGPYPMLQRV